jgi:hypothetical protein
MSYNREMKKRYTPTIKAKIVTELLKEENTIIWGRTRFQNVAHVQTELLLFETYCRHRHPLPEFKGQNAD